MKKQETYQKEAITLIGPIVPDTNADKSGTDKNSDGTGKSTGPDKFDKPIKEVDPDTTEIDTEADKTQTPPLTK